MNVYVWDLSYVFYVQAESESEARAAAVRFAELFHGKWWEREEMLRQIEKEEPSVFEVKKGTVIFAGGVLGRKYDDAVDGVVRVFESEKKGEG